jgi:acyl-CoA thioester hydrolase
MPMDDATRTAFQVEGDWPILRRHRIRWAECDLYAHVNHTAYLTLFEDLRVAFWEGLGGSFGPEAIGPVVGTLEVRYLKPAGFGDEVLLTCRTASVRRSSFVHEYAMWRADGLVCSARGIIVVTRGPVKAAIPEAMRNAMIAEGAEAQ